ncbi:DNA cytosine methyltransferase [Phenylobacterium parvum]|uniref:DNA (cytosine-5-)-methyltransferase n=1 Tax=Phenylobacterium parvum TaxID=2201350 RepID=A0A2Z3HM38_9CAUL|nr:DNA cytosine methyltransferase [Phenylobacterium parvum]AWM76312.1 DNA (cytosine-5-)-methyltransferase [Phenylobacterium parvum]
MSRTFLEFFAGGGMARLGLGPGWSCLFANDFDPVKGAAYRANFPDAGAHFSGADVWSLSAADLPGPAAMAWASSPCQDFSLAGGRAGLSGGRSSAFFGFWRLMEALDEAGRAPPLIVVENVVGLLTSRGGADFAALCAALTGRGYRVGAIEVDAAAFTPQSRPRLFVIAFRGAPPPDLSAGGPFVTPAVARARDRLEGAPRAAWTDWSTRSPAGRNTRLADLLEPDGQVAWNPPDLTRRLVAMMSPVQAARLEALRTAGGRHVGAFFRRTRREDGQSVQRAEARFDGLAGCLRTPRGGSSRQSVIVVEDGAVRTRLLTPREAARLMGLPEGYVLPRGVSAALHVAGDGVCVPAVRWLADALLEPLLDSLPAARV